MLSAPTRPTTRTRWQDLWERLRDPRSQQTSPGWARRSLEGSATNALLLAMATYQGVMVLVTMASLGWGKTGLLVSLSHLLAIGAALAVHRFERGQWTLILYVWLLFVLDWAATPTPESVLLFAACWMCNLNAALPAFLLRGKTSWSAPLVASAVIPVLMVIVRPDLATNPLVPGVFVTTLAITVATRIGLSHLMDYANGVDAEARALEEKVTSLTARKSATQRAAEDARVLHDTAINTLGAIANGGAALRDIDAVRQRCLADIAAIQTLRASTGDDAAACAGLLHALVPVGIRVRQTGLAEDELARTEALLPPSVNLALSRALAEAVQNAAKHSGAEEAVVAITQTAAGIRIAVSDQGTGIPIDAPHGMGIERSILDRAREAGIRAAIDSMPGKGTTVTLEYAFDDAADQPRSVNVGGSSVEDLVRQLRSRTAFALSAGLVGVGIVLAALNHPGEATPEWLMVAVVAAACWLAWREQNRVRLSAWTTIALMVSGPVAFFLSAWSVGFGQTHPILWQAIAPTGPLLALMIVLLPRTVKILGFMAYLLTVSAIAASVATISLEAAYITVVAGLVGLGLIWGVTSFIRSLAAVATRANHEQREAFAVSLELATAEAAADARRRWRNAGLEPSVSLLRTIVEGRADPRDPAIRARCAEEEAFLRQLSLLNPELIQMGNWFARALNASRSKAVELTVRSGSIDATAADAPQFGNTLLTVIDALPAGTKLTTAFFATAKGLAMTLVAPTPHLRTALRRNEHQSPVFKLQTFGEQDLAELVVAGSPS